MKLNTYVKKSIYVSVVFVLIFLADDIITYNLFLDGINIVLKENDRNRRPF